MSTVSLLGDDDGVAAADVPETSADGVVATALVGAAETVEVVAEEVALELVASGGGVEAKKISTSSPP